MTLIFVLVHLGLFHQRFLFNSHLAILFTFDVQIYGQNIFAKVNSKFLQIQNQLLKTFKIYPGRLNFAKPGYKG